MRPSLLARRSLAFQQVPCRCSSLPSGRSFTSTSLRLRVFQEGDAVILRSKTDDVQDGLLIRLRADKKTTTRRGVIDHADIIGKGPRQVVHSSKRTFRLHEPTLADYVRLTPRIVTPIYPSDANLIVSLLDIHVDTFSPTTASSPPYEILEAGTGHGALTLHLSRAIHAANPAVSQAPAADSPEQSPEDAVYLGESVSDLQEAALGAWKDSRRAIVHTLDISSKHSNHARGIVQGFRRGMYAGNVDFHVGDVSEWVASQRISRQTDEPFLNHILLDLPGATDHLANVAPALRTNGLISVFNPSITQIVECVQLIREQKLPYILESVLELGASNIRTWDVRDVKPRATLKKEAEAAAAAAASTDTSVSATEGQDARDGELSEKLADKEEKWATVCRPKVGEVVVGGGFLGLWRKMEPGMLFGKEIGGEDGSQSDSDTAA